jgi:hypothetical protein
MQWSAAWSTMISNAHLDACGAPHAKFHLNSDSLHNHRAKTTPGVPTIVSNDWLHRSLSSDRLSWSLRCVTQRSGIAGTMGDLVINGTVENVAVFITDGTASTHSPVLIELQTAGASILSFR